MARIEKNLINPASLVDCFFLLKNTRRQEPLPAWPGGRQENKENPLGDEKTRPDSVRIFLTGATGDGGAQADPDLSLGKNRSSTYAEFLGSSGALTNVTIDFVAGANLPGTGTLTVDASAQAIRWTAPLGAVGDWVDIVSPETKVVEDGTDPEKYLRITASGALTADQSVVITLADVLNNVIGFDNVSSVEAAAGDSEYRCFSFKNESAFEIQNLNVYLKLKGTARAVDAAGYLSGAVTITAKAGTFADWEETGFVENENTGEVIYYASRNDTTLTVAAAGRDLYNETGPGPGKGADGTEDDVLNPIPGIRIGKDAPSAQPNGVFVDNTGAGEGVAPGGVTFEHPTSAADPDVIAVGNLAAGYIYAIWIHRIITVGHESEANVLKSILSDFDAI